MASLFGYLQIPLLAFGAVSWRWPGVITRTWAVCAVAAAVILKAIPDWMFLLTRDGVFLECQGLTPVAEAAG